MVFVAPDFSVGRLSSAKKLSLVLANSSRGYDFIVSESEGAYVATVLSQGKGHEYTCFTINDEVNHDGIIIDEISLEVELDFSASRGGADRNFGSLIRQDDGIYLLARPESGYRQNHLVPLIRGLPACDKRFSAVFPRWAIVKREGREKVKLYEVDASPIDKT